MASSPEMMVTLMRFRRGAVAELHRHGAAQTSYVLEGRLSIAMPNQALVVSAGDCYLLAPNLPHRFEALTKTTILDIFAPGEIPAQLARWPSGAEAQPEEFGPGDSPSDRRPSAVVVRPMARSRAPWLPWA
jgi:quercetin dioxygenase-like cupin family protein